MTIKIFRLFSFVGILIVEIFEGVLITLTFLDNQFCISCITCCTPPEMFSIISFSQKEAISRKVFFPLGPTPGGLKLLKRLQFLQISVFNQQLRTRGRLFVKKIVDLDPCIGMLIVEESQNGIDNDLCRFSN